MLNKHILRSQSLVIIDSKVYMYSHCSKWIFDFVSMSMNNKENTILPNLFWVTIKEVKETSKIKKECIIWF